MKLLLPLGLLGLLGIAILIFIYIIKPNYQQKLIASTYVWKLSLKYQKKKLPSSRIRNILIFLCQLLALASFGFLLARPVIPFEMTAPQNEKVVIIDVSAGMLVASDNETRFERAVTQVREMADSFLKGDDTAISVILADDSPRYIASRITSENLSELYKQLDELVNPNLQCSYGSADMDAAAALAEEVLARNSETEILLYTATDYVDQTVFTVVNVAHEDDWNVAVLNCDTVLEENNCYSFNVNVGCYGRSQSVTVYCEIYGANGSNESIRVQKTEYFNDLETEKTLTFGTDDFSGRPLVSFDSMYIFVDEEDSFDRDNAYNVYGGTKQTIRIQYASRQTNNFFGGVLRTLRESEKKNWNIELKEVQSGEAAATEGFDFYIYEHTMPGVMPKDGVVLLVNPDKAPEGSGLLLGDLVNVRSDSTLASGLSHPLTENINPDHITVAQYRRLLSSDGYDELLYYNSDPIMLAKNEKDAKVVVLTLNLNMSSLGVVLDFPVMIYNIFNYYIPATLTQHAFEIGDTVTLNARGEELAVDNGQGQDDKITFEKLPATLVVDRPGNYTVTQKNMKGETIVEQFFVHIPNAESNITKKVDALPSIYVQQTVIQTNYDLLIWFAAVALALLFLEWWLHSRENIG